MPAIMTHDFFGKDAIGTVSELLDFTGIDEREAFLLGNQGPDPFFYLVANPLASKDDMVGHLMHDESPTRLLVALRRASDDLEGHERAVGSAFVAGFLCHYLLDSKLHPFIYATQHAICDAGVPGLDRDAGSWVHEEIERDLDEMVLYTKLGVTVEEYRPYEQVLRGSFATLKTASGVVTRAVAETYGKTIDAGAYAESVRCFRFVQRVFYSPTGSVRRAVGAIERRFTGDPFSLVNAMSHRVRSETTSRFDNREHRLWTNPYTSEVDNASFWDLYQEALDRVGPAAEAVFVPAFNEQHAQRITGDLNYSGRPVEP